MIWPLFSLKNELVTITINPTHITCAWIKRSHKPTPLVLKAHHTIPLTNNELVDLKVCNPTLIAQYITTFLRTHRLQNAFISLALTGPGVTEKLVILNNASPTLHDFVIKKTKHWHWEYRYLYPCDNGQFAFYVCGLPQQLLLQYQLLAIKARLNVIKITTERMALLHLYHYMYGTTFRQSQLAIHMSERNNTIEKLFTREMLMRMLHIPQDYVHTPHHQLLSACGLFVSERI